MRYGALAYLLKESSAHELIQAIQTAVNGRHYLSAPVVEHVVVAYLQSDPGDAVKQSVPLSVREQQVLSLMGAGQTNTEIAVVLTLSKRTIETYRWRLTQKLGLASQAELRRYALHQHRLPHP